MPAEVAMLRDQPVPLLACPACSVFPFMPFLRGTVQRLRRAWGFGRPQPYCALICSSCKEIVGYENPQDTFQYELRKKYRP